MAEKIKEVIKPSKAEKTPRPHSGVAYPYFDLASSIKVAEVVQNHGGICSPDLLAARLDYKSTQSGTYLTRISAARQFGLIALSGGNFVVTERAKKILAPVMPDDKVSAQVEAFLSVELFRKMYDQFRGQQLPPEVGLKNLFLNTYKIVTDRAQQAVRVFLSSAEQAGFFHAGRTRLIRPTAQTETPATQEETPPPKPDETTASERRRSFNGGGGGGGDGGGVDTAVIGLLRKLPAQGESWSVMEQKRFLTAFTHTIEFLYPAKGEANDA